MKILARRSGQMIVEYAVMFVVIVTIIVAASGQLFRPSVNRMFVAMSNMIDTEADQLTRIVAARRADETTP